jgi:diketogulonate reductase-like aldo/keto reductase
MCKPKPWAPIGGGHYKPFEEKVLQDIAQAHGKTIAQVRLRWNIQRGATVFPKSTRQH